MSRLSSDWKFQEANMVRILVHEDNCSYALRFLSTWDHNECDMRKVPDSKLYQLVLGPCFVQDVPVTHREVENCVQNHGSDIQNLYYDLVYPRAYEYVLLDGQRWFWIIDPRGVTSSLFLNHMHANYNEDTKGYQQAFWDRIEE